MSYGDVVAVDGLDLTIDRDTITAVLGPNAAGKTTTLKVLAGEGLPYGGAVDRRGEVGYLPQDPRTGDLDVTARDRVLSARGLDVLLHDMDKVQVAMGEAATDVLQPDVLADIYVAVALRVKDSCPGFLNFISR